MRVEVIEVSGETVKLTAQQQRVVKLLFKFRFVSAPLLGLVMGIRPRSAYEVLEYIVSKEIAVKVYKDNYRIDRKPAYYYLSKPGVTTVRKLLDVKESVVHALYKNDVASEDYIEHCLRVMGIYGALTSKLPQDTQLFTKTEINRFKQFPKNRPDLYIRTPDNEEAIVVITLDSPAYIIRKRLDEIITHSEDEGWDGEYPTICFVVKDNSKKNSLLYTTKQKLESMGMDDNELRILVAPLQSFTNYTGYGWANVFQPNKTTTLFE